MRSPQADALLVDFLTLQGCTVFYVLSGYVEVVAIQVLLVPVQFAVSHLNLVYVKVSSRVFGIIQFKSLSCH